VEPRLKLRPAACSAVEPIPQENDRMITRYHVCNAGPAARWKSPPAIIFLDPYREDGSPETSLCTPAATTYRRSEWKRSKGGRRESCDELSARTQGNHRLVRHPEVGSAYPQRLLANASANAACANQRSIRLVVTEQKGSDTRSRPFGVRPSYDDELGAVEALGLEPGAGGASRGSRRSDLGCFLACAERYTGNVSGPTVRGRLIRRGERALSKCGQTPLKPRSCRSRRKVI
jgi:hypothetical protein